MEHERNTNGTQHGVTLQCTRVREAASMRLPPVRGVPLTSTVTRTSARTSNKFRFWPKVPIASMNHNSALYRSKEFQSVTVGLALCDIGLSGWALQWRHVSCEVRTAHSVSVFRTVLTANSDCFPTQH
jgi:hypothetical protein